MKSLQSSSYCRHTSWSLHHHHHHLPQWPLQQKLFSSPLRLPLLLIEVCKVQNCKQSFYKVKICNWKHHKRHKLKYEQTTTKMQEMTDYKQHTCSLYESVWGGGGPCLLFCHRSHPCLSVSSVSGQVSVSRWRQWIQCCFLCSLPPFLPSVLPLQSHPVLLPLELLVLLVISLLWQRTRWAGVIERDRLWWPAVVFRSEETDHSIYIHTYCEARDGRSAIYL